MGLGQVTFCNGCGVGGQGRAGGRERSCSCWHRCRDAGVLGRPQGLLLTAERKRAATTAETFGSTLTSLLAESTTKPKKAKKTPAAAEEDDEEELSAKKAKAPASAAASATSAILSLSHARPPPSRSAENLERKAKKHLQVLKEEKEDRARVRDVVEGWAAKPIGVNGEVVGGQEFEKGLRKTAQRGGEFMCWCSLRRSALVRYHILLTSLP